MVITFFLYFLTSALYCDWEFRQKINAQLLIAIADLVSFLISTLYCYLETYLPRNAQLIMIIVDFFS